MDKIKKPVGVLLLAVFIFAFLHSEVGFLDHNDGNHSTHDHCTIVDGSTVPAVERNSSGLTKIKSDLYLNNIAAGIAGPNRFFSTENKSFYHIQKPNKVYLHNCTFLI